MPDQLFTLFLHFLTPLLLLHESDFFSLWDIFPVKQFPDGPPTIPVWASAVPRTVPHRANLTWSRARGEMQITGDGPWWRLQAALQWLCFRALGALVLQILFCCCTACLARGQAGVSQADTGTDCPGDALSGLTCRAPPARHRPSPSRSCRQDSCTAIPGPAWEILLIG